MLMCDDGINETNCYVTTFKRGMSNASVHMRPENLVAIGRDLLESILDLIVRMPDPRACSSPDDGDPIKITRLLLPEVLVNVN
jgi:hypothetical protein